VTGFRENTTNEKREHEEKATEKTVAYRMKE
jgi:hypothetical protein